MNSPVKRRVSARLWERLEIEALVLKGAHEALGHAAALRHSRYGGVIVIRSRFTSLSHASAMYCGPRVAADPEAAHSDNEDGEEPPQSGDSAHPEDCPVPCCF